MRLDDCDTLKAALEKAKEKNNTKIWKQYETNRYDTSKNGIELLSYGKWRVSLHANNISKEIGIYETYEEAVLEYNKKVLQYNKKLLAKKILSTNLVRKKNKLNKELKKSNTP